MKKGLLIGLALLGTVLATGCGGNSNGTSAQNNSSASQTTPAVTEAVTPTITEEATPSATETPSANQNTSSASDIGEEKARSIALDHAGLTEADVTFINVQLDRDDGRTVYDVDFYSGNTEYDYEIDASTGDIVSFDSDIENYEIQSQAQQTGDVISIDQAKEAALQAAGLDAGSVKWVKEKLDRDDGRTVYELECIIGDREYDFEINAADGTVLEQGNESVYDD
ncbi:MAG: PepSY domain-containing protein [Ruminococcus sp.]